MSVQDAGHVDERELRVSVTTVRSSQITIARLHAISTNGPRWRGSVRCPSRLGSLMPTAFVTGITGQDGQHLAEFLHRQGYHVFGMVKGQNNPRVEALQAGVAVRRVGVG